MALTKKHFERLADIMAKAKVRMSQESFEAVLDEMLFFCSLHNPNFDRYKFKERVESAAKLYSSTNKRPINNNDKGC